MAMYKIIHVDKSWIVCNGKTKLIAFERRSLARRAAHEAEELLHDEPVERKPIKPRSATVAASRK
jgi:hypothetical protein